MDSVALEKAVASAIPIEGCLTVEGLGFMAKAAAPRRSIVEVGARKGRVTKVMAATCVGKVFVVGWDVELETNLKKEIASGKVVLIRSDGEVALSEVKTLIQNNKPPFLNLAFFDSDHSLVKFRQDLKLWLPLVGVNYVVCGHDFTPDRPAVICEARGAMRSTNGQDKVPEFWWGHKGQAIGNAYSMNTGVVTRLGQAEGD